MVIAAEVKVHAAVAPECLPLKCASVLVEDPLGSLRDSIHVALLTSALLPAEDLRYRDLVASVGVAQGAWLKEVLIHGLEPGCSMRTVTPTS